MDKEFTQVEAEQEISIYPTVYNGRKSMRIWRKGDCLRMEIYNGWGTLDTTIHMTQRDLCGALKKLRQCQP